MHKTNAVRILDALFIEYELREYPVGKNLGAEHVASELGIPADLTVKTLVVKGDQTGVFVCCLSGDRELNLKVLAGITGDRKIEPVPTSSLLSLTGYVRGGVSPLGLKKNYKIFLDKLVLAKEKISMSAGKIGLQIWLASSDLLKATGAIVDDFSREKSRSL